MSTVVFYISGHGFGHASRQIEVLNALYSRRPNLNLVVRTSAAPWLFDLTMTANAAVQAAEVDTGVVQIDSLRLDEGATVRRADEFYRTLDERAGNEARLLDALGADLVIGDIPPLAFAAAALVGIQSVAVANFTWDWIYEDYVRRNGGIPSFVPLLRDAYAKASMTLKLPLAGGIASARQVTDIPFIARRSRRDPGEARVALGLPVDRPLALVSFGGYGLRSIDWSALSRLRRYGLVLATDPRHSRQTSGAGGALFEVDERQIYADGFRYEDLVAAADVVVTKPGYGIIAECVANGTALLYTSRGRFAEYDVLVAEMPRYLRSAFIDHADLLAGRWEPHLDRLLAQPPAPERPRVDGADVVADYILGQSAPGA